MNGLSVAAARSAKRPRTHLAPRQVFTCKFTFSQPVLQFSRPITHKRSRFFSIIVLFINLHHDNGGACLSGVVPECRIIQHWLEGLLEAADNMQRGAGRPLINTVRGVPVMNASAIN